MRPLNFAISRPPSSFLQRPESESFQGAYSVPRRTFLGTKEIKHCGWYRDRSVRLFDRRSARCSDHLVIERPEVSTATSLNTFAKYIKLRELRSRNTEHRP